VRAGKRVELKWRAKALGTGKFHDQAMGQIEVWHKWSFDLEREDQDSAHIEGEGRPWVTVKKHRWQRKYEVTEATWCSRYRSTTAWTKAARPR
jgi:hypothetical protein